MFTMRHAVLRVVAVLVALAPFAFAEADPPGRVARLSYTKGEVSFQPGGGEEWVPATLNRPLTTSDRLWTGDDARTELSIGSAALRMGRNTSFSFLSLSDHTIQVQLTQGTLNVRLRELSERENFEIDTPNGAITLLRTGDYRVDVYDEGNSTTVTARSGYAQVDANGRAFSLRARQLARIYGGDSLQYSIVDAPATDEFDDWCMQRNERMDRAAAARYVSPGVVGYEELDDYGYWASMPEYGMVWVPRAVPAGWAPYRVGHWEWISPWGWTWIDAAPWGFAPFHYGRWIYMSSGWGWVPGPIAVRPVYAPALVAFVGGNHWGIGFSGGNRPVCGWFPLGPHEPYFPAYRTSRTYITNVNITNTYIRNVHEDFGHPEHFKYAHEHRGITAVPEDAFRHGQPIQHTRMDVPHNALQAPGLMHEPPAAPDRGSMFHAAGRAAVRPPANVLERQVQSRISAPSFQHRPESTRASEMTVFSEGSRAARADVQRSSPQASFGRRTQEPGVPENRSAPHEQGREARRPEGSAGTMHGPSTARAPDIGQHHAPELARPATRPEREMRPERALQRTEMPHDVQRGRAPGR